MLEILSCTFNDRKHDIHFSVTFKVSPDETTSWSNSLYDELDNWYKCKGYVEVPDYEKKELPPQNEVWLHGHNMIRENKDGSLTFEEYFVRSPPVKALIGEVLKMHADPEYSVKVVRETYLLDCLLALARFWD